MKPLIELFGYRHSHLLFLYCGVILLPTFITRHDLHDRTVREADLHHSIISLCLPYEPKVSDIELHENLSSR